MARVRACVGGVLLYDLLLVRNVRDDCGDVNVGGSRAGDNIVDAYTNAYTNVTGSGSANNRRSDSATDYECGRS